jgi:hypothetical protein
MQATPICFSTSQRTLSILFLFSFLLLPFPIIRLPSSSLPVRSLECAKKTCASSMERVRRRASSFFFHAGGSQFIGLGNGAHIALLARAAHLNACPAATCAIRAAVTKNPSRPQEGRTWPFRAQCRRDSGERTPTPPPPRLFSPPPCLSSRGRPRRRWRSKRCEQISGSPQVDGCPVRPFVPLDPSSRRAQILNDRC